MVKWHALLLFLLSAMGIFFLGILSVFKPATLHVLNSGKTYSGFFYFLHSNGVTWLFIALLIGMIYSAFEYFGLWRKMGVKEKIKKTASQLMK